MIKLVRIAFQNLQLIEPLPMKTLKSFLLGILLILLSPMVMATHLVQEFFVPLPEDQVQKSFKVLYSGVGAQMNTVIAIVVTADNTVIHYDHWEDGYEVDLDNPAQSSTEVWGECISSPFAIEKRVIVNFNLFKINILSI